jgi:uncharacterized membrane protein
MTWLLRYRIRLYIRNSIWIFPVISIALGLLAVAFMHRFELAMGWRMNISVETGRTVMGTVVASMFTLVVVLSSAVLLVVQFGSAQLTPRIITFIYRSNIRKLSLALFVFTFTFSLAALVRIDTHVPWLTGYFAAYGFLVNLAIFLFFTDSIGKMLRPSAALQMVAFAGREVIRTVYPLLFDDSFVAPLAPIKSMEESTGRIVRNAEDGVVLAFDLKGLVVIAERYNCLIELVPAVGDFIAAGDPLFRIYEGGEDIADESLQDSVALGPERTVEQDPMFAFRVIVDIAAKALSPAINDPTTAVLAIDQIHHLLRDVGGRYLAEGREVNRSGRIRLVYRTPDWDDFVHLAVTEIRHYGRDSVQVMRRLRAMLTNLIETLPERRAPMLRRELSLLGISSKRNFPDTDDQILAETSDPQGIGGGLAEREHVRSTNALH